MLFSDPLYTLHSFEDYLWVRDESVSVKILIDFNSLG